jgi:hypothetical protein
MNILPDGGTLSNNIEYGDLTRYLVLNGWQEDDHENPNYFVFLGPTDIDGKPIKLVLPKNQDVSQSKIYISNAIRTIANIANLDIDSVASNIYRVERDVLRGEEY